MCFSAHKEKRKQRCIVSCEKFFTSPAGCETPERSGPGRVGCYNTANSTKLLRKDRHPKAPEGYLPVAVIGSDKKAKTCSFWKSPSDTDRRTLLHTYIHYYSYLWGTCRPRRAPPPPPRAVEQERRISPKPASNERRWTFRCGSPVPDKKRCHLM